jgi:hypothetical protein
MRNIGFFKKKDFLSLSLSLLEKIVIESCEKSILELLKSSKRTYYGPKFMEKMGLEHNGLK